MIEPNREAIRILAVLSVLLLPGYATAGTRHGKHPNIYAQRIVDRMVAQNPEVKSVELSVLSNKGCATLAATAAEDIGEACDSDENAPMKTGKPYVEAPTKNDPVYNITQALHDASGRLIGAVGMDIAPAHRSPQAVIAQAMTVLREMEQLIPSKEKLYEPALPK